MAKGAGRKPSRILGAPPSSLPLAAGFPRRLSRPQPILMLRNGEQGGVWEELRDRDVGIWWEPRP